MDRHWFRRPHLLIALLMLTAHLLTACDMGVVATSTAVAPTATVPELTIPTPTAREPTTPGATTTATSMVTATASPDSLARRLTEIALMPTATPIVPRGTLAERLDKFFSTFAQQRSFSGAVLLARDGEVVLSKAYGMASYEHDVPNTTQTKFRIGSVTKQFTAMLVMMLEEEGKLTVDDSICKYVSDCPDSWQAITLHHLLTHTSGIENITEVREYATWKLSPSPISTTVARIKGLKVSGEPGKSFSYSNSGYILLGYIVEKVSGLSYEALLRERIFTPLGMQNSGYDHERSVLKGRAEGYALTTRKAEYIDMSFPHGAGGLYSTVEDLYLWDQALYAGKLVSRETLDRIFTDYGAQYGYGWLVAGAEGSRVLAHSGGIDGFASFIGRYVDRPATMIILSNLEGIPFSLGVLQKMLLASP